MCIRDRQAVGRKVCEEILVIDVHDAVFQVAGRGVDRPVLVLHLVGVGMPRTVGGQHAVAAEGAVRSVRVVVVAAVTVGQPAFGTAPGKGLEMCIRDRYYHVGEQSHDGSRSGRM